MLINTSNVDFNTKDLLIESFRDVKKKFFIDLGNDPTKTMELVMDDEKFNYYSEALVSPFTDPTDRMNIKTLMHGTRRTLIETMNSRFGLAPYEVLSMPFIPVFYPRLLAKELVTFSTTDKPEVIKPRVSSTFKRFGDSTTYKAPSMTDDMSTGPRFGQPVATEINIPAATDILAILGLTSDVSHLEKNFTITHLIDSAGNEVEVQSIADVDGNFYIPVTINGSDDVVSGHVDYLNGVVTLTSLNNIAVKAKIVGSASVEENTVTTKTGFTVDKIRIPIIDRELEASYSIQDKMDVKSLYDIDAESLLLNLMAKQIALDIDREILMTLLGIAYNPSIVPASHIEQFSKNVPGGSNYAFGPKNWHSQIESNFNSISGKIYNDARTGLGNKIMANSVDAAIIRDIDTYESSFGADGKSRIGYKSGTINKDAFQVLDSPVMPAEKMLMVYKPDQNNEGADTYHFVMHTPGIVIPYPKNNKPSFSVLTRYGKALIQPKAIGVVEIV